MPSNDVSRLDSDSWEVYELHRLKLTNGSSNARASSDCQVHAGFFGDKLRFIAKENDRWELNQWHKEYALKTMTERARDDLYLSVAADSKQLLAVKYPHFSAKALQLIVNSIHEEGHLARKKSKGGGFNPYGSECPACEKRENALELAHTFKRRNPLWNASRLCRYILCAHAYE